MQKYITSLFLPCIFFSFIACEDKEYPGKAVFVAKGEASWYGEAFNGKSTASGEIFNKDSYTAAHPWLEFGTMVRVKNPATGKTVIVEINDRGPFSKKRILDLSESAAREIGILEKGFGLVEIEICGYKDLKVQTIVKHYLNLKKIKNL